MHSCVAARREVDEQFVEKDPATRAYHAGLLLAELGLASLARHDASRR
jgi:DNA-binding IclR family transcriptional regulator